MTESFDRNVLAGAGLLGAAAAGGCLGAAGGSWGLRGCWGLLRAGLLGLLGLLGAAGGCCGCWGLLGAAGGWGLLGVLRLGAAGGGWWCGLGWGAGLEPLLWLFFYPSTAILSPYDGKIKPEIIDCDCLVRLGLDWLEWGGGRSFATGTSFGEVGVCD